MKWMVIGLFKNPTDGREFRLCCVCEHVLVDLMKTLFDLVDQIGEDEEAEGIVLQHYPWEGSDRDYEYEEVI